jgi:hypothetical protein
MSDAEINTEDFIINVQRRDFRSAIASVMGQNSKGINRSKHLLNEFNNLDSEQQKSILAWAKNPEEKLPINDQRWYLEEIARHEMAHIVTAKSLGFNTGDATLVLYSPDGSHLGTSIIDLQLQTSSLSDVADYLERRIIILLAGYLAEPADAQERDAILHRLVSIKSEESDLQKAQELMCIRLNIDGISHPSSVKQGHYMLAHRASAIVEANFQVISTLAQRFSSRIEFYEQRIGWRGCEIDSQPEITQIVKV